MPYAKTSDGFKLYYEEHGASGTPLVLAYGIGGNTEMWDVNVAALSAKHRLILWEPRGHARSDSPEDPATVSFARWALDLRALLAMDHITDELPKIRVPVLLIGGDRDPSLAPMKVMKRKIRGSRLVVLSPASHFANRDQPAAWNRAALEFLARVDRPAPRRRS